jgi:S-adenosylmethionine hydrolase
MEYEHLSTRSEVEGIFTTGNHIEEVGMDTMEECMSKRRSEVVGIDMTGNIWWSIRHQKLNGLKESTRAW